MGWDDFIFLTIIVCTMIENPLLDIHRDYANLPSDAKYQFKRSYFKLSPHNILITIASQYNIHTYSIYYLEMNVEPCP